jgi:DNA-3-methyladenine glycosylase II
MLTNAGGTNKMGGADPLTRQSYHRAIQLLSTSDPLLGAIVARHGNPPFWVQAPGFAGLAWAILGQQVSIESAQATFDKFAALAGAVTPKAFLPLTAEQLHAAGFSRQKASYVHGLAEQMRDGSLDLAALERLDDDAARARLMQLRGVGRWTADTYLLFSLRRPDVWPSGDLALEKAASELAGAPAKLATDEVNRMAEAWRPWRAVAARLLWFQYLHQRRRIPAGSAGTTE